jgi:ABC-type transporter Mla subunit MlaD
VARPSRAAKERLAGIIITALLILTVGFCFATRDVRGPIRRAVVALPRADGIRERASVTYVGVPIGQVERLVIDDRRVVAHLVIHRADVELRRSDSIRIATLGIFGDRILELIPGPRTAPPFREGDTLLAAHPKELPGDAVIEAVRRLQLDSTPVGPPVSPP